MAVLAQGLLAAAGVLDGPHYRRGPGDEWWVRGYVASVSLRDGTRVDTREGGPRGVAFHAMMALLCWAGALMLLAFAWGSRRATGSRFAVNGLGRVPRQLAAAR